MMFSRSELRLKVEDNIFPNNFLFSSTVLKSSINKKRKKRTFVCAIDASKAFDKVNRTILWKQIIKKNISPSIIVSLIKYYNESFMLVKKNREYSNSFRTKVGVRQGGIASPKLFSIYTEELLNEISASDIGIQLNETKIDHSTKINLQRAINRVSEFGAKFEVKFNPDKTDITDDLWQDKLILDGQEIQQDHLIKRKKAAQIALSKLKSLEILTENTDAFLKGHLYKTYIMPV
ncbi:RNA-directed DNA polymerase from mobile element jockey-like [Brachionus plicatilis]|uniref:RNA-directed DNA polymerase from mobile element jockey-like n=1 Tax=Brachionus plicatilis TaxID=10195 RepID=A0A3M7PPG8_BRAPC|nr:RNA-directed DNA polymerase from mobile element jockey-like [Brachionus plicatilis]